MHLYRIITSQISLLNAIRENKILVFYVVVFFLFCFVLNLQTVNSKKCSTLRFFKPVVTKPTLFEWIDNNVSSERISD